MVLQLPLIRSLLLLLHSVPGYVCGVYFHWETIKFHYFHVAIPSLQDDIVLMASPFPPLPASSLFSLLQQRWQQVPGYVFGICFHEKIIKVHYFHVTIPSLQDDIVLTASPLPPFPPSSFFSLVQQRWQQVASTRTSLELGGVQKNNPNSNDKCNLRQTSLNDTTHFWLFVVCLCFCSHANSLSPSFLSRN